MGPICCPETSVTTNRRCVTCQKILVLAGNWPWLRRSETRSVVVKTALCRSVNERPHWSRITCHTVTYIPTFRRKCVKWTRCVGVTFPSVCLHVSSLKHLDTFLWNVALSVYSGSCPGKVILVVVSAVNVPTASAFYVELRSILIHVPRYCLLWNN